MKTAVSHWRKRPASAAAASVAVAMVIASLSPWSPASAAEPRVGDSVYVAHKMQGYSGTALEGIFASTPADITNLGTPDYWGYCVEHDVPAGTFRTAAVEAPSSYLGSNYFTSATIQAKALWVMAHSYPYLSLSDFGTAAGTPGISASDAIEATQYAIWRYTDLNYDAAWSWSTTNSETAYWHLVNGANASSGMTTAQVQSTAAIVAPSGAHTAGTLVGPFKVSTNQSIASVSVTGGYTLTDASGTAINISAVTDGEDIYVDLAGVTAAGSATVTVAAAGSSVSGNIVSVPATAGGTATANSHAQTLMIVAPSTFRVTDSAAISWTAAPGASAADMQATGAATQTVTVGTPVAVVTTCTNAGPQSAVNATCTVTGAPVGATTMCVPGVPVSALAVNGTITCTTTFTPATPGTVTLTTTAGSDTPDPNGSNNVATSPVTAVAPAADMQATGAATQMVTVGTLVTVVTTCTNAGPQSAVNATCTVTGAPVGATTTCAPGVPVAVLAVNGTITCTTTFTPATPGTVTLTTTAGSDTPDPNGSNNVATSPVSAQQPYICSKPTIFVAQGTSTQLEALVSGSGGSSFVNIGSPSTTRYNAIGYNTSDNFIYGVSSSNHLVRVDPAAGGLTDLGALTGLAGTTTSVNAGAFDDSGNYYVGLSTDTTHAIYRIDLATLAATQISISTALGVSDFTYSGGFFWAVPDGTAQAIKRIDPATGTITNFAAAFLPAASAYGAAWTYGNGNIGFSNNDTGRVYQIAIGNPSGTPTFTVVSSTSGPANSSNDGTACSLPTDLAITKTGTATVAAGGAISWTLTVTNNGANPSSGFVVTDTVPAGVTNVASSTAGCTVSGNTVTCVGSALAVNASTTIAISGNAPNPFTACITNSATVLGNEADPSSANNSASFQTCPPAASTDLAITKTGTATVAAGGAISWTLTVTNNGANPSSGFAVTDTVPAGVTNVASSTAGCTVSGSTVTCVGGALAVNASTTIAISGNAPNPFTACITNSASVLGNEADPSSANNSASFQTCAPASLASITTVKALTAINGALPTAGQQVNAGDVLTYTITSTNVGQTAGTTTLTETVPASSTYKGPDANAWTGCAPGAANPAQCSTVQNVPAKGSTSTTFTVSANKPLASGTLSITNVVTSSADPACAACAVTAPIASVQPAVPAPANSTWMLILMSLCLLAIGGRLQSKHTR